MFYFNNIRWNRTDAHTISLVFLNKKPGSSVGFGATSVNIGSTEVGAAMNTLNLLHSDQGYSEPVFVRSSRIALAVGFGGLLSIMALAGIDALRAPAVPAQ